MYLDNQEAFEFGRRQETSEEIELYDYVRRLAGKPSSQAQADFYRLLFDANTYPNKDVLAALHHIIDTPEFASTGKYVINRCFYTVGNLWLQDTTRRTALKELIMQAEVRQPSQPMDRYTRAWREQFENYAISNLYVALQHQMRLLAEDIPEKQEDAKFSSNLKHLHFIQESVTVTEDIPKNLSAGIRQLRAKNIKLLHQQLNHYANGDQNRNGTPLVNPTGLSDNTLKESIGQYRPDRENSIYSQANDFLQNVPCRNLRQLRQELSWYIREPLAAKDERYKKGSFVQRLDKVLQQGDDDDMVVNAVSVTTILQRVMQFLVVKDIRLNNPVELKNLIDKVGHQVVTTVLLRLVLFWRRICPWLESRFGILFHVYEHQRKCDINPIVLAFEHVNVALALNYQQVGYC